MCDVHVWECLCCKSIELVFSYCYCYCTVLNLNFSYCYSLFNNYNTRECTMQYLAFMDDGMFIQKTMYKFISQRRCVCVCVCKFIHSN